MIGLASPRPLYPTLSYRDDSSSLKGKRRAHRRRIDDSSCFERTLLSTTYLRWWEEKDPAPLREQRISSSKNRRFVSLRKTLPLTASKGDEPIVEGSTIRLVSQDPSFDWVKTKRDEPLSFLFKITPLGTVSGYSRGRKVEVESRQLSSVK